MEVRAEALNIKKKEEKHHQQRNIRRRKQILKTKKKVSFPPAVSGCFLQGGTASGGGTRRCNYHSRN